MGAVFGPRDFRGRRRIVDKAIEDITPTANKDDIIKILDSWDESESTGTLEKLLRHDSTRRLLDRIRSPESDNSE
jgi:hypothetical protein